MDRQHSTVVAVADRHHPDPELAGCVSRKVDCNLTDDHPQSVVAIDMQRGAAVMEDSDGGRWIHDATEKRSDVRRDPCDSVSFNPAEVGLDEARHKHFELRSGDSSPLTRLADVAPHGIGVDPSLYVHAQHDLPDFQCVATVKRSSQTIRSAWPTFCGRHAATFNVNSQQSTSRLDEFASGRLLLTVCQTPRRPHSPTVQG